MANNSVNASSWNHAQGVAQAHAERATRHHCPHHVRRRRGHISRITRPQRHHRHQPSSSPLPMISMTSPTKTARWRTLANFMIRTSGHHQDPRCYDERGGQPTHSRPSNITSSSEASAKTLWATWTHPSPSTVAAHRPAHRGGLVFRPRRKGSVTISTSNRLPCLCGAAPPTRCSACCQYYRSARPFQLPGQSNAWPGRAMRER